MHPGNARLERHAVYTFSARYAEQWRAGRVFLAGDAAHLMPPFAGQGMCSGLRDAANLAWKLDLVLAERAADALLDSYQSERLPSAQAAIEFSMELGKVICVPDPAEAAARDEAMAAGVGDEPAPAPGLPDIAVGFIHPTAPHAGTQLVQGTDGGRPFDDVHGDGWRLVVLGADVDCIGRDERAWFESIGGRVVALADPDPIVRPLVRRARHDVRAAATRLLSLRHRADGGGRHVAARRPPPPSRTREHRMKLANHDGRAALVLDDAIADVHDASGGRFGPDLMSVYDDWPAFVDFAAGVTTGTAPLVEASLACPVPAPRQVFAIGLNYRSHAEESGMAVPDGAGDVHEVPGVAVGSVRRHRDRRRHRRLGGRARRGHRHARRPRRRGRRVVARRRSHRRPGHQRPHLQFAAGAQFSLGKSRRGYGPMGPWLVTLDEVPDPDDLALGCSVDGETVQDARTSDLIFCVPRLVAELSAVLPLLPGDVIFTGTPAGVGATRQPARFLQPGQVLETWIEGIGTIRNRCV